ncbi:MAG: fimbrillin family protein [Bacteroidaceae bacterium]|nr:fimbrillin family protein [Bacteroidaceae bacterium]
MKVNSIIAVVILTLFSFCACTQEQEVEVQASRMLSIKVDQGGIMTRATLDGLNTTFTEGDEIGIIVVDANNILYHEPCSYDGNEWFAFIPCNPKFDNYKYFAYYPYNYDLDTSKLILSASTATEFFSNYISDFVPQTDQSTLENYMASDLMTSLGTYDSSTGTVSFKMDHEMGLAIFNVVLETGEPLSGADSSTIFNVGSILPYMMPDSYYLIVHPDNPVDVYLGIDDQQAPTSIRVAKGKYTNYTKYSSGV